MVFDFKEPVSLIIIEDEKVSAELLGHEVERSSLSVLRTAYAESLDAALDHLNEEKFDVMLLDLNLPDSEGLQTLIRVQHDYPDVAKVVITGEYDEELGLEALACGAEDYLVKGKFDVYVLSKSIAYAIERKRMAREQDSLIEELLKVNDELEDFAYIVSHDLKAPLRGITSLSEWLQADYGQKLDEAGREKICLLKKRVQRMHELIDAILQYSRIGRTENQQKLTNLNNVVSDAVDAVAAPENISVTVENEMPCIECDPTRIGQVFQNLIANAVKYMDKEKGWVKIKCESVEEYWKFSVGDNGCGIEQKDLNRIFQLFQRGSSNEEPGSTGIGLTLVKKIVELYGGRVSVDSRPAQGSTFFFTLPKQKSEVLSDAKF